MSRSQLNIIIAGIGGQGINSFTRKLQEHCFGIGFSCVSSVYKGGAQRLGSVHSEIKIFSPDIPNTHNKTSQIIPGTLSVLIGLEQWETLRYLPFCNQNSLIVMDQFHEFPPGVKQNKMDFLDPISQLRNASYEFILDDFAQISRRDFGNKKDTLLLMWNFCMEKVKINELKIK